MYTHVRASLTHRPNHDVIYDVIYVTYVNRTTSMLLASDVLKMALRESRLVKRQQKMLKEKLFPN